MFTVGTTCQLVSLAVRQYLLLTEYAVNLAPIPAAPFCFLNNFLRHAGEYVVVADKQEFVIDGHHCTYVG